MKLAPLQLELPSGRIESNQDLPACVSIVMPVYNEAPTVPQIVNLVLAQPCLAELIIVDDASTDQSWAILEKLAQEHPKIRLLRHPVNQGKGAALRTGLAEIRSPLVILQDADCEYDPAEYHLLLQPIVSNKADVVFGTRFLGAGAHRVLFFWHSLGNRFLTMVSNMLTNLNLTDMETGYKAFRAEVIQRIRIQENRFGFEPEITAKVSRLKARIYEVPISYHGRTYAEGKKIVWKDGVSALRCIFRYALFD